MESTSNAITCTGLDTRQTYLRLDAEVDLLLARRGVTFTRGPTANTRWLVEGHRSEAEQEPGEQMVPGATPQRPSCR